MKQVIEGSCALCGESYTYEKESAPHEVHAMLYGMQTLALPEG